MNYTKTLPCALLAVVLILSGAIALGYAIGSVRGLYSGLEVAFQFSVVAVIAFFFLLLLTTGPRS